MHTSGTVIVVGAGFAGLSAATELADRGARVHVLESRERVGGRVWSTSLSNGAIVEMGAEWIMSSDTAVQRAAARFQIPLVSTGSHYGRREPWGPDAASLADQDRFLASAAMLRADLTDEKASSMSLGSFLDRVPGKAAARQMVKVRLAGTCASDLDGVALGNLDEPSGFGTAEGPFFRMGPGNMSLADAMAERLDVRTGAAVDTVEHDGTGVLVRSGPSELRADAVVVAVPAPLAARMRFVPALPDRLASVLESLQMGVASKLAVATKGVPSIRSRQASEWPMWCWTADGEEGVPRRCVSSFAGSAQAQRALEIDAGRVDPWLNAVARMNPDLELEGEPVMHAWADDPYALGSYSAWDHASLASQEVLSLPVGRVAFAGEHTAGVGHSGTMEGALRSGRRAADQILAMIG